MSGRNIRLAFLNLSASQRARSIAGICYHMTLMNSTLFYFLAFNLNSVDFAKR